MSLKKPILKFPEPPTENVGEKRINREEDFK